MDIRNTSIVILTYNQLDYTKRCLDSIRFYTKPDYEIIIVDNASTDGTVEWLKEQKDIIAIFNDVNKGFPAGCNQGILKAGGDIIVLLNNDTIVTPRWLDNIATWLNSSEKIGAVGVYSNSAGATQSISVSYGNYDEMILFADKFNVSTAECWEERIRLSGFCFAVKKHVVNEVGLLDERFSPGNYEDDDYSFRIRQAGYRLMLCKDTFVHHYGNISFKNDPTPIEATTNAFYINQKKFEEKWGGNPSYHALIRVDVISLMRQSDSLRNIRVLEIGCACGGTLLKIKHLFPYAELFGIEINQHAAGTACSFANIRIGDVEKINIDYPYNFFDYILFPDVLEHIADPWNF